LSEPRPSQPGAPPGDPFAAFAAAEESELHLADWLRILAGRWRLVALVTLLATAFTLGDYLVTPKEYRATTLIQIERRLSVPLGGIDAAFLEAWYSGEYYPTQYRLLRSRGLAERVVLNLRLDEDPALAPERVGVRATSTADDQAALAGLASRILAGLEVQPLERTQLVEISYRSLDPERAARVANGVADAFIDWGIETRTSSAGKASLFYGQQIESLKGEIRDKERELQAYGRRTDIVSLDPKTNVILQRLEALNQDYIRAVSDRIAKEVRLRELESAPSARAADVLADALVAEQRAELADMERDYASKLNLYKPEWPAMIELRARIDQARRNLGTLSSQALAREREAARVAFQTANRQERSIVDELDRVKTENRELSGAAVEFSNLQIEIATKRELLDELLRKQSETDVTSRLQATRESNVRVVDRALVPGGAFRPSLQRSLTLGLGGGALGGVALVFLLFYMDRTIKSGEEIERQLEMPVLATIPDVSAGRGSGLLRRYGYGGTSSRAYGYGYGYGAKKRRRGAGAETEGDDAVLQIELLPHDRPRLAVAEAYRTLRTALLLSTAEELRAVAVTSAVPGEGKTSTAANLAVVLAQLPKRVLLVDGDLRKPRLHQLFRGSNRAGLVNFLTHTAEVEQVVFQSKVPNLWIVPSGPVPPNPSELIASERMGEFVDWARRRFEMVVFDSAPTLAVTDAILLGKRTDGVVLCLRAGYVQRRDARSCRDRLRQSEVRVLGAVLNCHQPLAGGYGKRYGYADSAYGAGEGPVGEVAAL